MIWYILNASSILAAYDLGAQPGLLRKIYEDEAKIQRPIVLEDRDKTINITGDNWTQYLGDAKFVYSVYSFATTTDAQRL